MTNISKKIGEVLPISTVEAKVSFKKTKIYRLIEKGEFPPQKKYGGSSKWWATQIEYYLLFQCWNEKHWEAWVSNTASETA